jgi:predicted enzyme related to lactoylglutathione lyase
MSKVIHFEICASNVQRAVKFYREVFGWQIDKWGGEMEYWLAVAGREDEPGINGAITPRSENMSGTVNTISVLSLDDAMQAVTAAGGKVLTPCMTVPGVGCMAYCLDSEGNQIGVMEEDRQAK